MCAIISWVTCAYRSSVIYVVNGVVWNKFNIEGNFSRAYKLNPYVVASVCSLSLFVLLQYVLDICL